MIINSKSFRNRHIGYRDTRVSQVSKVNLEPLPQHNINVQAEAKEVSNPRILAPSKFIDQFGAGLKTTIQHSEGKRIVKTYNNHRKSVTEIK